MLRAATVLLLLTVGWALAQSPAPIPRVPAAPGRTTLIFTGRQFPPPGTPADQALLGELLVEQGEMLNHRAWAITATQRLADGKYDARLAEVGGAAAADLRDRLRKAWEAVTEIMTKQWLVDPRIGCRQQGINLEGLMGPDESQAKERLAAAREAGRGCLSRQGLMVRPLAEANRKLDARIREADAMLGRTPGPAGASGPPAKVGADGGGK